MIQSNRSTSWEWVSLHSTSIAPVGVLWIWILNSLSIIIAEDKDEDEDENRYYWFFVISFLEILINNENSIIYPAQEKSEQISVMAISKWSDTQQSRSQSQR